MANVIDFYQPSLYFALAHILFNPIFWNTVARAEYNKKVLTKLAGGNAKLGCYGLAVTIFTLADQPTHTMFDQYTVQISAALLFITGNILVLSSMWALGVTGTYLGDYFGILMKERVTGFPFNVCDNPMYVGSTCTFLATALWYGKPAGVFLTSIVYIVYKIALTFEEPFTGKIYANKKN
ncbi:hypothetical protein INT48_007555 [Thamnidium elegans]|uniref:Phosphatidyl-N-methylethanolamine N-methyltransferase n=1 Tax=Thamnidium elegans TaxID=101142 RepID=A0A8H7SIH2_9FUNG|nr:hypothetical protein INT48_007555 [Thamnidium elegans]